jgi:hypothetical protein
MSGAIRRGVMVAVVLGSCVAWSGVRADDDPYAASGATSRDEQATPAELTREVFEPGAASMEPAQSVEAAQDTEAHQAWVESIHDSP